MSGLEVVIRDPSKHPRCPHGPTILFSKKSDGVHKRSFFACSACRDRKLCPFFLYEDELDQVPAAKAKAWEAKASNFTKNVNHRKLFLDFNEAKTMSESQRVYCKTCSSFEFQKFLAKHDGHDLIRGISDHSMEHPTEFLPALEDTKKEAQFLFSKPTLDALMGIFKKLNYKNIISIGTPKLHEFVLNDHLDMNSLLLDIDKRYLSFYGPMQFCWYNSFNHHFFLPESKDVFEDFLRNDDLVLIVDPPFGGRVEPLAYSLNQINEQYKKLRGTQEDLPIFWIFPYFMEPQIRNSLPNFKMLDYKVDYVNHPLFQDGPKGRKQGSPVRIFTNVDPRKVALPEDEGYKLCKKCQRWVSSENKHCKLCNACTSKDGRTYTHCKICERCVKPTWTHCEACKRCAQADHKCGQIAFSQECFNCKKPGHKKRECPEIDREQLQKKRKLGLKTKSKNKSKRMKR